MSFFVDEIKISYNAPANYWALMLDLQEKTQDAKKLEHLILDKDEKMEKVSQIHLNQFMLEL